MQNPVGCWALNTECCQILRGSHLTYSAGSEGRDGLIRRASASLEALLGLVKSAPSTGDADKAPWGPHVRRPSHVDVARLDACSCGPHG